MPRYAVWAIAVLALCIAAYILKPFFMSTTHSGAGPEALTGLPAPVFTLRDDRGAVVSLERYRGHVVLMNLWASWCPPCRAEMPDLQRLADARARSDLVIIGVNEGESPARAREFADSLGIRFPIWIDASERYGRTYAALGLPTSVILDRNGTVVHGYDGPLTFAQMQAAVTPFAQMR